MHWIDPDSLPEYQGTIERFILNPHGEIDGFVLLSRADDAPALVHIPPHMESDLVRHVKRGETVRVRALRPRGAALLAAVAVTAQSGTRIIDEGPDDEREHPKFEKSKMTAAGQVRLSLFGPKGELRGALLADGTAIRIGPKEAREFAALLQPGAVLAANGDGIETSHGRVIHAREIGPEPNRLKPVKNKPEHGPKHKPAGGPKHARQDTARA